MIRVRGDIWDLAEAFPSKVVVPTNVGWKADGDNPMGRGLAKDAARRYPGLANWYGWKCSIHREKTPVLEHPDHPLVLFPTKPFNAGAPHLSWKSPSSLELIGKGLVQLAALEGRFLVPLLGCGNGGLDPADVIPLLERHLPDPRFVLVQPGSGELARYLKLEEKLMDLRRAGAAGGKEDAVLDEMDWAWKLMSPEDRRLADESAKRRGSR